MDHLTLNHVLEEWTPKISTAQELTSNIYKYGNLEEVYCNQCNHLITDVVYTFGFANEFNLCQSCYPLPHKTRHFLHTQHPLTLHTRSRHRTVYCFVCDGCLYVSFGRAYVCDECDNFRCCVECAWSKASRMPIEHWGNNSKPIYHYSHFHLLNRCRYKPRVDVVKNRECSVCELPLWGVCYGCVHCVRFIHESCLDSPQRILHPIHPSHPLKRFDYTKDYDELQAFCKGCTRRTGADNEFFCEECENFSLHLRCADSLLRTVQHECHPHGLLYTKSQASKEKNGNLIDIFFYGRRLREGQDCGICKKGLSGDHESCYRCVECSLEFHFNCARIPSTFKHDYHLHALTLVDSFDDEEYLCDICETVRMPNSHAYCCQDCNFVAHIECVLSKKDASPKFLSCLSQAAAYIQPSTPQDRLQKTRHMSHKHELQLIEAATDPSRKLDCKLCHLEIRDHPVYTCCQSCDFWAHKKCIDLPQELFSHPLHSHSPLKLFAGGRDFMCQMCRDVSDSFCFICRGGCGFVIDVKCAFETQDTFTSRYLGFETEVDHPLFGHLLLVNPSRNAFAPERCELCHGRIDGLRYWSPENRFYCYHDSCIKLPLQVEHHPLHPNRPLFLTKVFYKMCQACGYTILHVGYSCKNTEGFCLHVECAFTISRFLKLGIHDHRFYYFHEHSTSSMGLHYFERQSLQACSLCHGVAKDCYYRCGKCELNVHLECLRLPRIVKHKWHLHPLVYKDSVDFGGFYCDICEEEIVLDQPVYCCEACKFAAHIDCLVSEENASNVMIEEIEEGENSNPLRNLRLEIEKKERGYHSSSDSSSDSSS